MSNDLPEWDGNLENLPALGSMFLYKEKRYRIEICDCGCEKPVAISIDTEEFDLPTTIRIRAKEQGNPLTQLLIDLGKTSHEVADSFEKDGLQGWLNMRKELLALDPVGHGLITPKALFRAQVAIAMEMGL